LREIATPFFLPRLPPVPTQSLLRAG